MMKYFKLFLFCRRQDGMDESMIEWSSKNLNRNSAKNQDGQNFPNSLSRTI